MKVLENIEVLKNNSGQEFYVIGYFYRRRNNRKGYHKMFQIMFKETGTVLAIYEGNMSKGKVKDPYSKSRLGVGYCGFPDKSKSYWKRAKQLWSNMIKRCYLKNDDRGYNKFDTKVCERWLCFANFLEDLSELENFDKWLENGPVKYNLDKDFIIPGNNIYAPKVCLFVEESINKGFTPKRYSDISKYSHKRLAVVND